MVKRKINNSKDIAIMISRGQFLNSFYSRQYNTKKYWNAHNYDFE